MHPAQFGALSRIQVLYIAHFWGHIWGHRRHASALGAPKMPKKVIPLSDLQIKNAKPQSGVFKLADGAGLYLEIHPTGAKYWRLKYRFGGKEKRLALGVYPEISLTRARAKQKVAREQLDASQDPADAKRQEKREQKLQAANTFELIARAWHKHMASGWKSRYADEVERRLESHVFGQIGKRPVAALSAPDILQLLRKIEDRGTHEMARRIGQVIGQIFRYAISEGFVQYNPVPDLRGSLKIPKSTHYASIDATELPEFLLRLEANDARLYVQTRLAMKLLMLTFVRTGELINANWSEFDLEHAEWVIPGARIKMGLDHIVPLSKQTVSLLEQIKKLGPNRTLLFPNQVDHDKAMSNNTILSALASLGYKGRMTGHGFRSLAMTVAMERLGYRFEVVDRQLAHSKGTKVRKAYDRAQFIGERRALIQDWADYLDTAGNVPKRAMPARPSIGHPKHDDALKPISV
jgi:integrase